VPRQMLPERRALRAQPCPYSARTGMGVTFEKISVLVFSIEQTSQEDLFRTNRGAYPPVPFEQPREVMTQVSSGPAFAGPHQALAAIESAIGYLAAADATAMAADLDRAVAAEQAPEPASTRSREGLQLAIIEAVVPSRDRRASVGSSRPPGPGISPAGHPPGTPSAHTCGTAGNQRGTSGLCGEKGPLPGTGCSAQAIISALSGGCPPRDAHRHHGPRWPSQGPPQPRPPGKSRVSPAATIGFREPGLDPGSLPAGGRRREG
jgi:hypothetical protein